MTAHERQIRQEFGKYADDVLRIEAIMADLRMKQARYWATHKKVVTRKEKVDRLPCADFKACKLFADAFGYKYSVKKKSKGVAAVFYREPGDIGKFDNTLDERWAIAIPSKTGYDLIVYQAEQFEVVER